MSWQLFAVLWICSFYFWIVLGWYFSELIIYLLNRKRDL